MFIIYSNNKSEKYPKLIVRGSQARANANRLADCTHSTVRFYLDHIAFYFNILADKCVAKAQNISRYVSHEWNAPMHPPLNFHLFSILLNEYGSQINKVSELVRPRERMCAVCTVDGMQSNIEPESAESVFVIGTKDVFLELFGSNVIRWFD